MFFPLYLIIKHLDMKATFEKYKYSIVQQNGVSLVVAGFSKSHVIGATKEENNHTWRELDEGSYIIPHYDGCNYIYISEELLRFKPTNDE